jgi:hypothetical protein
MSLLSRGRERLRRYMEGVSQPERLGGGEFSHHPKCFTVVAATAPDHVTARGPT